MEENINVRPPIVSPPDWDSTSEPLTWAKVKEMFEAFK